MLGRSLGLLDMEAGRKRGRRGCIQTAAAMLFLLICRPVSGASTEEPKKRLKLGLISPPDGNLGFGQVACATTMAIEQAQLDGFIPDTEVSVIWRNGNCNAKTALGVTVDLRDDENVDAYIGLPCSIASINAGKIIAHWNLPHWSYSSVDPILADKYMYNTLVRLMSPYNTMAAAMVEFLNYYHWTRVVMVMIRDGADNYCDYTGRAFESALTHNNITVADWFRGAEERPSVNKINKWLAEIKKRGRIVLICANNEALRDFMIQAREASMTNGEYVFVTSSLLPAENLERRWVAGDGRDNYAREAFQPLLQFTLGFISSQAAVEFMEEIPRKMAEPPWNYNKTLEDGLKGSMFSLFLFDTVYLYAMVADEMYKKGISPRNGSYMLHLAKSKSFVGKTGVVMLDSNADRIGNYEVWHLPNEGGKYVNMMEITMTDFDLKKRIRILEQRTWGHSMAMAPKDQPECGFFGELCPQDTTARDNAIVAVVTCTLVLGLAITVGIVIHRKKKFEQELDLMLWKVRLEEIDFLSASTERIGSSRISSRNSSRSDCSLQRIAAENKDSCIRMGYYRGAVCAIKTVEKIGFSLSRQDHIELKTMREVNHENINNFIGACVEPPSLCTIFKFCSKGSLQDILMNDDIKVDHNFTYSFIMDIIHGLEYLHRSPLKCHGRLKSTNCVVDGRWVVKITDWGVSSFRRTDYETEIDKYKSLIWTAPELLRGDPVPVEGTQMGDVYSFAIIMQEILFRAPPFHANGPIDMVPKDMVGRIRNGETPPFRPDIKVVGNVDLRLLELMKECWKEDANHRPDFAGIKTRLTAINKGKRYNIMDNMLHMMEKYATNLEEVVGERTQQLMEEKKKIDALLYKMLPATVADCLKTGKNVQPEHYKEASIYFSDIVQFTKMCSESTPLQVVDFLNDLWTNFDDVITRYDVYKVETIGDAYMVASGVPVPNPAHASEIANMALDILSSVLTFKIRHMPQQQLRVRIGLHCGSVVAGVVGQTMPRYCLFGDAVNTASRMESTGEALRIHISESAAMALKKYNRGFITTKRGQVEVKGKGLQTTYWLDGKEGYARPLPRFTD